MKKENPALRSAGTLVGVFGVLTVTLICNHVFFPPFKGQNPVQILTAIAQKDPLVKTMRGGEPDFSEGALKLVRAEQAKADGSIDSASAIVSHYALHQAFTMTRTVSQATDETIVALAGQQSKVLQVITREQPALCRGLMHLQIGEYMDDPDRPLPPHVASALEDIEPLIGKAYLEGKQAGPRAEGDTRGYRLLKETFAHIYGNFSHEEALAYSHPDRANPATYCAMLQKVVDAMADYPIQDRAAVWRASMMSL